MGPTDRQSDALKPGRAHDLEPTLRRAPGVALALLLVLLLSLLVGDGLPGPTLWACRCGLAG